MIVKDGIATDVDRERIGEVHELIAEPDLAVAGLVPEEKGPPHAPADAVVEAGDVGIDELSASDGHVSSQEPTCPPRLDRGMRQKHFSECVSYDRCVDRTGVCVL